MFVLIGIVATVLVGVVIYGIGHYVYYTNTDEGEGDYAEIN